MYNAEQERENRLYYIRQGRCPHCGGQRPIAPGHKSCEACMEKERQRKREEREFRLANGLCTRCGRPRDDERYNTCERCRNRDADRERNRKRYNVLKLRGMCVRCGERAAEAGKVMCKLCRKRTNQVYRDSDPGWAKRYERRDQLIAAGLCIDCSQPTENGKQRCPKCIEARRDSTTKYRIIQRIKREADRARGAI